MDEFKPEDELKPDASDRRPSRPRKSSPAAKIPVSRQRIMMGVGILVLLLLVLGIGSALNGPDEKKPATAGNTPAAGGGSGSEKNIDLAGSSSMSGGQTTPTGGQTTPANSENNAATSGNAASDPQRDVSMPPVASTPTQAAPVETPANQQRVTLPGDLNSALSNQQQQVDSAAMGTQVAVHCQQPLPRSAAMPERLRIRLRPLQTVRRQTNQTLLPVRRTIHRIKLLRSLQPVTAKHIPRQHVRQPLLLRPLRRQAAVQPANHYQAAAIPCS